MKRFRTPLIFRWIFFRRVWHISSPDEVYITFDDGPTGALTEWILRELKEKDVRATFFCVGSNVASNPELYQKILAGGHAVGNHTMCHEKGTETTSTDYMASVQEAAEYIESDLFRPPYGRLKLRTGARLRKNYRIVMWSWLAYDFDTEVPTEKILESARNDIRAGDIIVLHDNRKVGERLKILLPELITVIREKGLGFGLISA